MQFINIFQAEHQHHTDDVEVLKAHKNSIHQIWYTTHKGDIWHYEFIPFMCIRGKAEAGRESARPPITPQLSQASVTIGMTLIKSDKWCKGGTGLEVVCKAAWCKATLTQILCAAVCEDGQVDSKQGISWAISAGGDRLICWDCG